MRIISTFAVIVLGAFFTSSASHQLVTKAEPVSETPNKRSIASCSCNDVSALTSRLKGVEAVLSELGKQGQGPANRGVFDADTFDSALGETITRTLLTAGGIGNLQIAQIDRFSCEVDTGENLSNITGMPAGLGGSACLREAVTAQLNVRRQACLSGRNSSNEGTDYWEGRRMSEVIRELNDAYTAEANFIKQQLAGLAPTCRNSGPNPRTNPRLPPSPPKGSKNWLWYEFEGERTLPFVGRIRMTANETIPFTVATDNTISGTGTINTVLDMSGSPCQVTGYNGVADILVTGEIIDGFVHAKVTPRGSSQRTSAPIKITCPPKANAHLIPQQQNYALIEILKVPEPGQPYTEKIIDVNAQTMGAMQGIITLRLFMSK